MSRLIEVSSFGFGHDPAPAAHDVRDLRPFRDPHLSPEFRHMTAKDLKVRRTVMATPGVVNLVVSVLASVDAYLDAEYEGPVRIAVGCTGGRHRAPTVAIALHAVMSGFVDTARDMHPSLGALGVSYLGRGLSVSLSHRDIDKPVIQR
ncbi:RNase adapter RapZ [Streptomyces sp. 891-h]|uniref:RapZ C-terminal domain-containing protein n=1 Tax=Streptomyces sp. 891-h TaxID=2720714 RepID=UPI001FAA4850|nr:RNase adapter RapZ [Streptomyces sp. 891-h]UNZ20605.1 ATPase [Streptomyces sp. 891-h]